MSDAFVDFGQQLYIRTNNCLTISDTTFIPYTHSLVIKNLSLNSIYDI